MIAERPPRTLSGAPLELAGIPAGRRFGRIYPGHHPDPLGFARTASRFSDPSRRKPANRFGVLYLGETLEVCFAEAILRDRRNGLFTEYVMAESEFRMRRYAEIAIAKPLAVVDLRGNARLRLGVPSDVVGASRQALARRWSLAFYAHPQAQDGIAYPSRLNGDTVLAVYDRAIPKLRVLGHTPLLAAPGLARVLETFRVAVMP